MGIFFLDTSSMLFFALRLTKYAFKFMYVLFYLMQCNEPETQIQICEACQPILSTLDIQHDVKIQDIGGNINEQLNAIKIFMKIVSIRRTLLDDILPGEHKWEKPCCKYVHTVA